MKQSVFVQQQGVECDFTGSTPWVILSPIEQSIKQKIEAVGTPLKDWDINIYRGVLTGYNDAFIIDTEKREAILANCQTEEERKRTAELIRPILRGRDIRRYEYEWADKYLIATFPSRHYDIELYPAVKRHLLSFGKERLEQTGKTYSINGEKIKARKKTHNKWFETQDSISYWEDFNKPKIVYPNMTKYMPFVYDDYWEDFMRPKIIWKRIGSILRFSYDTTGNLGLDSTCFATGQHMAYLCCILNSLMGHYMFKDSPKTGTGDLLVSVQAIEPILIPMNKDMECLFENLLEEVLEHRSEETEKEINRLAFKLYDLSPAEINYITDFVTQSQQSQ